MGSNYELYRVKFNSQTNTQMNDYFNAFEKVYIIVPIQKFELQYSSKNPF